MHNFLDVAESLLRSDECGPYDKPSFELVFKGIAALQPLFAKAVADTDNLESVFAAFEMAALFGQLGSLEPKDVRALPAAIKRVIVNTLETTITLQAVTPKGPMPPAPYQRFAGLLEAWKGRRSDGCVLTFNYDLALDYALHFQGIGAKYCLGDDDPASPGIDLLKLHGSLNWTACPEPKCGRVFPVTFERFFKLHSLETPPRLRIDLSQRYIPCPSCGGGMQPLNPEPVIIPPTWSKMEHYPSIAGVWKRAAEHLAQARDIFVFGYSLRETDQFFRYLYALGTISPTRLRRFWVFDVDATGEVEARFRKLLGPLAARRFRYIRNRFGDAINQVSAALSHPDR